MLQFVVDICEIADIFRNFIDFHAKLARFNNNGPLFYENKGNPSFFEQIK